MRIRVRNLDGDTVRVELPELCDFRSLLERVSAVLIIPLEELRMSLNKRDEIDGPGNIHLSSFGIRGGDMLYVLPSHDTTKPAAPAADTDRAKLDCSPKSSASSSGTHQTRRDQCAAAAARRLEAAVLASVISAVITDSASPMDVQNTSPTDTCHARSVESSVVSTASDQTINTAEAKDVAPLDVPGIFHRLLEEGEKSRQACSQANWLLLAVHAAMLDTGFRAQPPPDAQLMLDSSMLPKGWKIQRVLTLKYSLADTRTTCNLRVQTIGGNIVIYGAVEGSSKEGVTRLSLNLAAQCSRVEKPGKVSDIFQDRRQLWKDVKDKLALPLLHSICRHGGKEPLASLLSLPSELALQIFMKLPPRHQVERQTPSCPLVVLACTCSRLRFLVAEDQLWKAAYESRFGANANAMVEKPAGRSWKVAFATRWRLEREREQGLQRLQNQFHDHLHIQEDIVPRHPYFQPPGMVGGDYDRFPFFTGRGVVSDGRDWLSGGPRDLRMSHMMGRNEEVGDLPGGGDEEIGGFQGPNLPNILGGRSQVGMLDRRVKARFQRLGGVL